VERKEKKETKTKVKEREEAFYKATAWYLDRAKGQA